MLGVKKILNLKNNTVTLFHAQAMQCAFLSLNYDNL